MKALELAVAQEVVVEKSPLMPDPVLHSDLPILKQAQPFRTGLRLVMVSRG
jgi:hypothetical protein